MINIQGLPISTVSARQLTDQDLRKIQPAESHGLDAVWLDGTGSKCKRIISPDNKCICLTVCWIQERQTRLDWTYGVEFSLVHTVGTLEPIVEGALGRIANERPVSRICREVQRGGYELAIY
jgi:hypothetical protein